MNIVGIILSTVPISSIKIVYFHKKIYFYSPPIFPTSGKFLIPFREFFRKKQQLIMINKHNHFFCIPYFPIFSHIFSRFQKTDLEWIDSIEYCIEKWPIEHGRAIYSVITMVFQYVIPILIVSIVRILSFPSHSLFFISLLISLCLTFTLLHK